MLTETISRSHRGFALPTVQCHSRLVQRAASRATDTRSLNMPVRNSVDAIQFHKERERERENIRIFMNSGMCSAYIYCMKKESVKGEDRRLCQARQTGGQVFAGEGWEEAGES